MNSEMKKNFIWKIPEAMKLIVFSLFSLVVLARAITKDEWRALLRILAEECQSTSGADIEEIKNTKIEEIDESDEKIAKFFYCMEFNSAFIEEDGNLDYESVSLYLEGMGMMKVDIDIVNKICGKLETTAPVPTISVRYFKCYRKYLPENTRIL